MFRRLFVILLVFCLLPAAFVSAEEKGSSDEPEIDITDLVQFAEEETLNEKKDSDGAYILTITCTGDFTIGGDNYHHKDVFTKVLNDHDGDINFVMQNVRDIFTDDDLTLINFEGTFTDTTYVPPEKRENQFLFNISPSYVSVLTNNSVEAVSLDNNHVRDHGDQGYEDTKSTLSEAGVIYSTPNDIGVFDFKGEVEIAMLSYLCIDRYGDGFRRSKFSGEYSDEFLSHDTFEEAVCADIRKAKEQYPFVIVSFHWGKEPTKTNKIQGYIPTQNQIDLGHAAVDAGADLVIGHHSHRIQPIEYYNGTYICYSLGNFCFAGNNKPDDMNSIVFQIRYRVKEGNITYKDFRVIPIRISSNKAENDFIPTPFEDSYERDGVINMLKENSLKYVQYPVTEYPLEWR